MNQDWARKKRVLFVEASLGLGGSTTNVLYPLVACLDRDQYEPVVLFYWPNPYCERFKSMGVKAMVFDGAKPWRHPAPISRFQGNRVLKSVKAGTGRSTALYHALGSYVRLSYYIPQISKLATLMKANDVDLVHLNQDPTKHGREIVLAAKLAGLPCVCYVMNFGEFQAVDRQIARLVDRYAFCSDAIAQHCFTHGGISARKARTIHHGIMDAEKWSQPYDTSQVRQELGWSDEDFVVGNIGRLVSWKGQDIFLKALAEVKRQVPEVKGLIVGSTDKPVESPKQSSSRSYYEELLALTESLGLTDNVRFTGFRKDIPQLMAAMDVLVHSSSEPEPFATVVIEGMMAGRPVIATDAGGMPEMIDSGVTGQLVPLRDPQAMAQAILFYCRNQAQARQMARAGQERATTEFTARRNVDEFQGLYRTLLVAHRNG